MSSNKIYLYIAIYSLDLQILFLNFQIFVSVWPTYYDIHGRALTAHVRYTHYLQQMEGLDPCATRVEIP